MPATGKAPAVVPFEKPDLPTADKSRVSRRPATFRGPKIDLLKRIKPTRNSIVGQWQFEQEALVTPQTDTALLEIPFSPARSYQIEAVSSDCLETICLESDWWWPVAGAGRYWTRAASLA